jgi:hypothetical protein
VGLQESLKKEISTLNVGCRVKLIRAVLNDSELKLLDDTLKDESISTAAIVRALKTEGYDASIHSVGRHRRGDCVCGIKRIT